MTLLKYLIKQNFVATLPNIKIPDRKCRENWKCYISIDFLTLQLNNARVAAMAKEKYQAAINANIALAKLHGLWMKKSTQSKNKINVDFIGINKNPEDLKTDQISNHIAKIDVDPLLDEVTDYPNLQAEQFEQLTQAAASGVPIPPAATAQASALPNKKEIMKYLQPTTPSEKEVYNGKI